MWPSFEEWKLESAEELDQLITLDKRKYKLAEQVLMMDLHQQASFRQYQEILAQIGAFKPTMDTVSVPEHTLPEIQIQAASREPIDELGARYDRIQAEFQMLRERLMVAGRKGAILDTLPPMQDADVEVDETLEEHIDECAVVRSKFVFRPPLERAWKEVLFLRTLEKHLQVQLAAITDLAVELVRERKWHVDPPVSTRERRMAMETLNAISLT